VLDYIDVAPRFGIVKIRPPESFVGKTLRELDLPTTMSLTPIALRRGKGVTVNPHRDERVEESDELLLIGLDEHMERLGR
jgi:trk system potassium uptake protein TrkA